VGRGSCGGLAFGGCGYDGIGEVGWCWWLDRVEERLRESHGVGEAWCVVLEGCLLSRWSIDNQSSLGKQLVNCTAIHAKHRIQTLLPEKASFARVLQAD
jgi:hypothetical protein